MPYERMTAPPIPVVFIHGLWIHSDAWQPWVELSRPGNEIADLTLSWLAGQDL
jgi:hypothetical protein